MPTVELAQGSPPRVLFFLDRLGAGGVERITLNLLEGLVARGWRPILVLTQPEGELLGAVPRGIEVLTLGTRRFCGTLLALAGVLEREAPQIVVSQRAYLNVLLTLAATLARTRPRLVLLEHSLLTRWWADARVTKRAADTLVRHLLPHVYGRADALVAVSRGIARDYTRILGRPDPKIHLLHNAIARPNLAELAMGPLPLALPQDGAWVVAIGRLEVEKNHIALLEAFAEVARTHAVHLILVGEGPERGRLEARARELGLFSRVHLVGFQANPYAWIARSALLVLPSLFETFPTVLVEAMVLGTPVVSFDCPEGPREIVTHGVDGLLVEPESTCQLARAIARVLDDPKLAYSLREGGRQRAQAFTYGRTVSAYEDLFRSLVAAGHKRQRVAV